MTPPSCSVSFLIKVLFTFGGQKNSNLWQIQILKTSSTCKIWDFFLTACSIKNENKQDVSDSHAYMINLFENNLSGTISVWNVNSMIRQWWLCKETYVCFGYLFNKCVIIFIWDNNIIRLYCVIIHVGKIFLTIYVWYRANNVPGYVKNVVDGLNATNKRYLKEKMELIGKLANSNS